MGLTDKGFERSTYDDILSGLAVQARELFGEDIDTSDQGALGKFLRIIAYRLAQIEEELEAVYYARYPATASGQSLDRLLVFGGISRNPAEPALYSVRVWGAPGTAIAVGTLFCTDTELTYYSTTAAEIGDEGTCTVEAECTEAGILGNVSPAAINRLVNPAIGITAVEGLDCITAGRDVESDAALRQRLLAAFAGSSGCNEDAIVAELLRVPTVQFAAVISNDGDTADSEGRPPHSFECYVLGGEDYDQEIAEAIFSRRPVGIQTTGTKSATAMDVSGNPHEVRYSSAPRITVYIKASVRAGSAFPGEQQVYESVAEYVNNLGIGQSLVLTTLYGYIYAVPGVLEVTALTASTDGEQYSTDNIKVPVYGIAVCADVSVEVAS